MTRANTERPQTGGGHSDALESGYPSDKPSEGAGTSDKGTGYTPGSENAIEKASYPGVEQGNEKGAGGPMPSTAKAQGVAAKGIIGDGRGSSGRFSGTMGSGAKGEPKSKGTIGS